MDFSWFAYLTKSRVLSEPWSVVNNCSFALSFLHSLILFFGHLSFSTVYLLLRITLSLIFVVSITQSKYYNNVIYLKLTTFNIFQKLCYFIHRISNWLETISLEVIRTIRYPHEDDFHDCGF